MPVSRAIADEWYDEFVVESRGELLGYLRRLLNSSDDAQEVAQEAYLKVFVALRTHRNREHAPKALLYTTARNLALSRLRHRKVVDHSARAVEVCQELQMGRRSPEQHASSSQDMRALLLVVNQLPPKCRTVLLLRMLEGLSQKEIAARVGIAVSTVEKHLAKALHRCRDRMAELRQPAVDNDALTAASEVKR